MPGAATSRTAAVLAVLAVGFGIAVLGTTTGSVRGPAVAALAGGLLGVAVIVRAGDTPLGTALASALTLPVGALAVASVGLSLLDAGVVAAVSGGSLAGIADVLRSVVRHLGVAVGAGIGALGAVGTLRDGIGDGGVGKVWQSVLATLAVIAVALGVILVPRHEALSALPVGSIDLSPLLDLVLSPADPAIVFVTFWALVLGLAESTRLAIATLPLAELVSRSRKRRVLTFLVRADRTLKTVAQLSLLSGLAGLALFVPAFRTELFEAAPAVREVVTALATPALRSLLLALVVGLFAISVAVYAVQRAAGRVTGAASTHLPAALGGILAVAFALLATPLVGAARSRLPVAFQEPAGALLEAFSPVGFVLAAVAAAVFVLLGPLSLIAAAGALGYVPSRAAGGAFAAAGLVVGAVSVGATGGSPLVVFVVIALALLAWDASEHGVTTRAELKTRATGVEAVHAVGSLAVALLGVGVAWASHAALLGVIAVPDGSLVGTLGAIVAALFLLGVLRG